MMRTADEQKQRPDDRRTRKGRRRENVKDVRGTGLGRVGRIKVSVAFDESR
jgi:hypothetical protein